MLPYFSNRTHFRNFWCSVIYHILNKITRSPLDIAKDRMSISSFVWPGNELEIGVYLMNALYFLCCKLKSSELHKSPSVVHSPLTAVRCRPHHKVPTARLCSLHLAHRRPPARRQKLMLSLTCWWRTWLLPLRMRTSGVSRGTEKN